MEGSLVAYKVFTNGSVLNASEMNEYLMNQAVITFSNSTARSSAITSPVEGMVTYLEDSQTLETFNGTSWIRSVLGESNTSLGKDTLVANTTGANNVALGVSALAANTTGGQNTAIGEGALSANTTANNNTAIGRFALLSSTTATRNVAIGQSAMVAITTGGDSVGVGFAALTANTTGVNNTAIGHNALRDNTTGNHNTAIGKDSLLLNTGVENTAIGRNAGNTTTTGGNNSFLGHAAVAASATTSNSITLGNSSITSLRCQVTTISSLSDQRDKKEIKDLEYGLDLINKVRPVEFTWDTRDGSITDKPDIGFIAQELAEVEDNLNDTDRLRLTLRDNPEKLEATPGRLLPIAIKAIQELSAQNADLLARLEKLENK
jgi:hypothetical protein